MLCPNSTNMKIIANLIVFAFVLVLFQGCIFKEKSPYKPIGEEGGIAYRISEKAILKVPFENINTSRVARITDYPDIKVIKFEIGPVTIEPQTSYFWQPAWIAAFPFDVWITRFECAVYDSNNKIVNEPILFHANIVDPNKRELFYPVAHRLFITDQNSGSYELPGMYGIPVKADEPLLINAVFRNLSDTARSNIYLAMYFNYSDKKLFGPVDVMILYLDAGAPVFNGYFTMPSGKSRINFSYPAAAAGHLFAIGGHIRNFNRNFFLVDSAKGDTIWKTVNRGTFISYLKNSPRQLDYIPKWINSDHTYNISVQNNYPLSRYPVETRIGTITALFRPDNINNWDTPDYSDNMYRNDLQLMIEGYVTGYQKETKLTSRIP